MKKLICVLLALLILFPAAAAAEDSYAPSLEMTFAEFIRKYNQVPALLDSPYKILAEPYRWNSDYDVIADFYPEENQNIVITLYTKDPAKPQTMDAGLDRISISIANSSDWVALLAVTKRCMSVIFPDDYDIYIPKAIVSLLDYYHGHNIEKNVNGAYTRFGLANEYKLTLTGKMFFISKAE